MLKGVLLTLQMGPAVPAPVPLEVIEALTSVQVTVGSGQRSGFQLTFGASKQSLLARTLIPAGYFDPMIRVIIVVTVNGSPEVIMDGLITRQQLTPSNEPGQSTLVITGEDVSQAMDLTGLPKIPFAAMPPEARVALLLAKYAVLGIVPEVIPSIMINVQNPADRIPTQDGTDLQYITQLANEVGYVFYVEPGPVPGMNRAYWGPEIKVGAVQPALSVNMDSQTNVESINFTYDGLTKTLYLLFIQALISPAKVPIPIPVPDVTPLNPPLGVKPAPPLHVKLIGEAPGAKETTKYSPVQAAATGLAAAAKSADVITGSGTLDVVRYGQPLRARQLVGVRGAGPAYDGLYYVKSVTHDIKHGEYKQNFTLSRNALIPFSSTVPV
jgi:hypothetical protein